MKQALFSRTKVWTDLETIANEHLNLEFNNFINNLYSGKLGSGIETVAGLQTLFDPGEVGSENLPSSTLEHIQSLQQLIKDITGKDQWYETPGTTLEELESALDSSGLLEENRIVSGRVDGNNQPMYLQPDGTLAKIDLLATTVNLATVINGESVVFTADDSIDGLPTTAGGAADQCQVNDASLTDQEFTRTLGERYSVIPIDTLGANVSAKDGTLQAFQKDSEIFIAEIDVAAGVLKNAKRGWMFDDLDSNSGRDTLADGDTITLLRMTWVFGNKVDDANRDLDFTQNQPYVSGSQPAGAVNGDYWFDLVNQTWKKLEGASFNVVDSILLGVCAVNDTACIGARSLDFDKPYSSLNTLELQYEGVENVRSKEQNVKISLYGTQYFYNNGEIDWTMSANLDAGVVEAADTTYYLYLTDQGDAKISDISPHERLDVLRGFYHPSKPWRCVGSVDNDSGSDFDSESVEGLDEVYGAGFTSTSAQALDIATLAQYLFVGRLRRKRTGLGALALKSNASAPDPGGSGADDGGGSAIHLFNRSGGTDSDGRIDYVAYGDGSGGDSNKHRFYVRTADSVLKLLVSFADGLATFTDTVVAPRYNVGDNNQFLQKGDSNGIVRLRNILEINDTTDSKTLGVSGTAFIAGNNIFNKQKAVMISEKGASGNVPLYTIRGVITKDPDGEIRGEGFQVTTPGGDLVRVEFDQDFDAAPTVVATCIDTTGSKSVFPVLVGDATVSKVDFRIYDDAGTSTDGTIHFIAIGPYKQTA
jgi:hypothetical protein